jgi:DNA repair exonuclease SbcCD ATPase subunit
MTVQLDELKTPLRKMLSKLIVSRDKLRSKYKVLREQLRVAQNQVRAVENSRQLWKDRAIIAEKEIETLKKNFTQRCGQSAAGITNERSRHAPCT